MDLLEWAVAQLKTIPALKLVAGVEELEEAEKLPLMKLKVPAAFVLLLSENAGQSESITVTSQRVQCVFGVVLAVENKLNPMGIGSGAKSRLQEVRGLVKTALRGQTPAAYDPTSTPVEFARGRMARIRDNVLWWQDEFRTDHFERSF